MKSRAEYENYLSGLIQLHEPRVAEVLKQFGIHHPPNPEVLILAFAKYGSELGYALNEAISPASFTGAESGSVDWTQVLTLGTGIITGVSTLFGKKQQTPPPPPPPAPDQNMMGIPPTLFIGLAVVLVMVMVFAIVLATRR
jgi:hypothetical protein